MKGLAAAATFLLAATAADAASTSLLGIRGNDDRVLADGAGEPWSAIGRLNREGGGFCTGVAVDPVTVLTAAHCLWNPRTLRWGGPQTIHFLAGYRRGEYLQHARVASYRVGAGKGAKITSRTIGRDWAILKLSDPLDEKVRPLPVSTLAGGAFQHLQAGYSQDKPHILTVDGSCRITASAPDSVLLTHDCDATYGSSGAPLLARDQEGRYAVVGLHVANTRDGKTGLAIAAAKLPFREGGEQTR